MCSMLCIALNLFAGFSFSAVEEFCLESLACVLLVFADNHRLESVLPVWHKWAARDSPVTPAMRDSLLVLLFLFLRHAFLRSSGRSSSPISAATIRQNAISST